MKQRTKHLDKFFALLLSLLILISVGGSSKVWASGASSTVQKDAKAALTKVLQMPKEVKTPKADLEFTFTKTGDNAANTPDLAPVKINIPADKAADDASAATKTVTVRQALTQISTAAGGAFAGKPAGIYEYTVKETAGGIDTTAEGKLTKQAIYSQAEYKLQVLVSNKTDSNGAPTGEVYIEQVVVVAVKDDAGVATNKNDKLSTEDGTGNKFIFNNKYSTTVEEDNTNDPKTAPFSMEKKVTGSGDVFQAFDFSITINRPELLAVATPDENFTYSIVKTSSSTGVTAVSQGTHAYGTPLTFKLAHGDKLIINKMYGGSTIVTADETDPHGHTKSVKFTPADGGTDKTVVTNEIITGKGAHALVTNDKTQTTQVGFFLDNAPVALAIVLSVGLLVAFVVVNRKRKAGRE